jgi:RimJ/RimL family protein N-acetyltransferase
MSDVTGEVVFRRVKRADLRRLIEITNEPEVAHYLTIIPPVSMQSTLRLYENCKRDGWLWYCMIVEGKITGSLMLRPEGKRHKSAHVLDFGISISREYWGRGLGNGSMKFMLRKARELGYKKVVLGVVAENIRARRLYERHGFKREGIQRRHVKIGGVYHDNILMARFL